MTETNPYEAPSLDSSATLDDAAGEKQEISGLGGWLILVAIGLILAPLRLVGFVLSTFAPLFTDGTWQALSTPGSEHYVPFWGPLVIFEIVVNGGLFIASIMLIVFFFGKKRRFPKAYIYVSLATLGFIVLDAFLTSLVLPQISMFDNGTLQECIRSVVGVAIWVPYMLVSKRVKNTFVQ